jgi:signal transduction histidine kinase
VINEVPAETLIQADGRRLEQMLTNLVENAIKFNREGGSVRVSYEQDSTASRSRISVADTGEGIPAQHLERLFERFYRVDRARSRELGGIGLGLAIVKHLARGTWWRGLSNIRSRQGQYVHNRITEIAAGYFLSSSSWRRASRIRLVLLAACMREGKFATDF